jgi:FMN phosphatase YigB (HAD superfamily)
MAGTSTIRSVGTEVRAVLFDLDGTLYHQGPVRRRMALELALLPLRTLSLPEAAQTWKRIRCFRKVREELRVLGLQQASFEELQYDEPARQLGDDPAALRETIEEWMGRRPLRWVARHAREDLREFLSALDARGIRAGVFSDYPVRDKLEAMGVLDAFSLTLCATDPEINAFKPHPRGFGVACERWGLAPREVLYVGDRADVDLRGASAAGMPCALIGDPGDEHPWTFSSLRLLSDGLEISS